MPYVGRDENGNIKEICARPQPGRAEEFVDGDVELYVPDAEIAKAELEATDKDMARVAEDVIQALITKGLIAMGDLPQSAQDKINQRAAIRGRINGS